MTDNTDWPGEPTRLYSAYKATRLNTGGAWASRVRTRIVSLGRLDVAVVNAAIARVCPSLLDTPTEDPDEQLRGNVVGPLILALSRTFREEVRSKGVRVSTLCPRNMDTTILGDLSRNPASMQPPDLWEMLVQMAELRTYIEVGEIMVNPLPQAT